MTMSIVDDFWGALLLEDEDRAVESVNALLFSQPYVHKEEQRPEDDTSKKTKDEEDNEEKDDEDDDGYADDLDLIDASLWASLELESALCQGTDREGETILHRVVRKGYHRVLDRLCAAFNPARHAPPPSTKKSKENPMPLFLSQNSAGSSAFHLAVERGDAHAAQRLVHMLEEKRKKSSFELSEEERVRWQGAPPKSGSGGPLGTSERVEGVEEAAKGEKGDKDAFRTVFSIKARGLYKMCITRTITLTRTLTFIVVEKCV